MTQISEAKATLQEEYQAKMAELDAAERAAAERVAAASHLDATRTAQAAAQTRRQAELDKFENGFTKPTREEFEAINAAAATINAEKDAHFAALQEIAQRQRSLVEKVVKASRNAGLRAKTLKLTPDRMPDNEFSKSARVLWEQLFKDCAAWTSPVQVFAGFVPATNAFRAAERALMSPDNGPLALGAPAPQAAQSQVQPADQTRIKPAQATRRTSLPVETWIGENVIVGKGATLSSKAYEVYKKACEEIGVKPARTRSGKN